MWNRYQEDEAFNANAAAGTAVVYGGRTDTCRQYAEWLSERRDADLFELRDAKLSAIKNYRTLIYILPIYDGQVEGLDSLVRNYPKLMKVTRSYADDLSGAEGQKRVSLLAVGLCEEKDAFRSGALDMPTALEDIPVFYARGRYLPEKADSRTTLRIGILQKAMEKDPALAASWIKVLASAAAQGQADIAAGDLASVVADFSDPAYLDPVLDLIDGR